MNCAAEHLAETDFSSHDKRWMRLACLYASRAQGHSWPNPAVGCVLVSADNRLIAVGSTQPGGRPHAEADALLHAEQAGRLSELKGGVAYVTLEPCAHKGRGPACADLLAQSGVSRVVYAVDDPDERVNGKGHGRLIESGVIVHSGLLAQISTQGLSGFLSSRRRKQPYLISKIATSADGFISAQAGQQTWLTNEQSRRYVHDLRSRVDGLITGIQTVLIDDPALTCRLPGGRGRTPVRIVFDSCLRLPLNSQLVKTVRDGRVVVFCAQSADKRAEADLQAAGLDVVRLSSTQTGLNLIEGLRWCEQNSLSLLLVEAGTTLNKNLFDAGLLDRLIHLSAPKNINTGVAGLLYDPNTASALAFPCDSAYISVKSGHLSDDQLTIWQKAD